MLERLQSIDPKIIGWCVVLTFMIMLGLLIFYIPRTKDLIKLRKENKELKAAKDYAIEQWAIDLLNNNRKVSDYEAIAKNEKNKANRANKKAEVFAELCDKMRGL